MRRVAAPRVTATRRMQCERTLRNLLLSAKCSLLNSVYSTGTRSRSSSPLRYGYATRSGTMVRISNPNSSPKTNINPNSNPNQSSNMIWFFAALSWIPSFPRKLNDIPKRTHSAKRTRNENRISKFNYSLPCRSTVRVGWPYRNRQEERLPVTRTVYTVWTSDDCVSYSAVSFLLTYLLTYSAVCFVIRIRFYPLKMGGFCLPS